jgi:hypothetical protein
VEDGVGTGDVRNAGQQVACRVHDGEGGRDVQRRESGRPVQSGADVVVDQLVAAQLRSAVDDAMTDGRRGGCCGRQPAQRARRVLTGR